MYAACKISGECAVRDLCSASCSRCPIQIFPEGCGAGNNCQIKKREEKLVKHTVRGEMGEGVKFPFGDIEGVGGNADDANDAGELLKLFTLGDNW